MVDIPGNSTTTTVISVGSTTNGSVEVGGDHDWFKISLSAGQTIQVTMNGLGLSALEDPYLRIRDSTGAVIFENDDSGGSRNAFIAFQATYSGDYYIDAAAWENDPPQYNYTGDYELKVEPWQQPPLATIDQIANQLTHGFWGGDSHHFAASQGGTISVNLTALTGAGQSLAREALRQWSDIIGISFAEVGSGGQIIFDDSEDGASTGAVWADGIMSSAHVNVAASWLHDYGTTVGTYSFQTYLHEIGHALGLGHAGNYDGEARFPYDALFLNDAAPMSVMSYFSPRENTYFSGLNFSDSSVGTPMLADIVAISKLYGLSTTTRLGNTTYGFNSTAGNSIYNATLYPTIAYTVFDSGGVDTLDYSGFAQTQFIDLNSGAFSNVGGSIGNVTIAIGTLIENAIAGSGDDTLIGNGANNLLNGGGGYDTVSYATASAGVTVNLTLAGPQNTIGAGTDSLIGFETLVGSNFDDRLTAGAGTITIRGGGGNDTLVPSGGNILLGEAGDDTFISGVGSNEFGGGDGFDTVDYSGVNGGVIVSGSDGLNRFSSIERIIGSNFGDQLQGVAVIMGGAGNDTLSAFSTGLGGTGDDIYNTSDVGGQVLEAAGEGTDLVRTFTNYTLPENVENLLLLDSSLAWDPYAGAGVPTGPPPPNAVNGSGNSLDNIITGNPYANQLNGLAGADTLYGGGGNDTLDGGLGDDLIDGGAGEDTLVLQGSLNGYSYAVASEGDGWRVTSDRGSDFVKGVEKVMLGATLLSWDDFLANGFDALRYVASYPDLAAAFGLDTEAARQHYVDFGKNEGRSLTLFDAFRYGASNRDLLEAFGTDVEALTKHYIQFGIAEGRSPTAFNALLYAASHPDLAAAFGSDEQALLHHYINWGIDEGRATSGFDALLYAASYPDLAAAFGTDEQALLRHYIGWGINEGRATSGFDALLYAASNPDLASVFGADQHALAYHYVGWGMDEGRPTQGFDAVAYLINNPDLGEAGFDASGALYHWVRYGVGEGRTGNGAFGAEQDGHLLAAGGDLQAAFDAPGDLDWYSIDLAGDQSVNIALDEGAGNRFVSVYDHFGRLLAFDEDSGANDDASLTFNPSNDGSYIIVVGSTGGPDSYTLTTDYFV